MESASDLYDAAGTFDCVSRGDLVAIKLHVGELGNPHYVPPFFVHRIAERVKAAGGKPFLTDSNTYYHGMRANACDHMENATLNGYGGLPFILPTGCATRTPAGEVKGIRTRSRSGPLQADAMIVVS
jgi:uncharacterized Fe-S center protein